MFDPKDHIDFRNNRYFKIKKENPRLLGLTTIEINPTELCNRQCSFCPRYDSKLYPNRNLNMTKDTAALLVEQLKHSNFSGDIHITGFGEPTLNPNILDLIEIFSKDFFTEMITNGDRLLNGKLKHQQISDKGLKSLIVDCYDDERQYNEVCKILLDCEIPCRVREHYDTGEEKLISLYNFNNRAGMLNKQSNSNPCYLPFYKTFVDWNGDVRICCNDWARKQPSFGNIHEKDFSDIWNNKEFMDVRHNLLHGKRHNLSACKNCNINGMQQGKSSVEIWQDRL